MGARRFASYNLIMHAITPQQMLRIVSAIILQVHGRVLMLIALIKKIVRSQNAAQETATRVSQGLLTICAAFASPERQMRRDITKKVVAVQNVMITTPCTGWVL